jgi:hypothetical protein
MKLTFGKYWIKLEGEPGEVCEVTSNLKEEASEIVDSDYIAVVDGVESTMLALYSHGILQHANLTQVQLALADTVDAIDNNLGD